jgi:hypothetical protein
MQKLFRKKSFLEIYIPLAIPIGAVTAMFTGVSLLLSFILGMFVTMIGCAIFLKRKAA